ncbi:hypothetical protein Ciccas_011897 [Cichlidogyrus casuarinus]|uniref:Uncharacterized protein n=1 Tax=Cichlidogyrus casuarinus TaxID=1844966 RepID=A0ABD2PPY2_9PLAT
MARLEKADSYEHLSEAEDQFALEDSPVESQRLARGAEDCSMSDKKSVSFSVAPKHQTARITNAADCYRLMQRGSEMIKLRTSGRQYRRAYFMDDNLGTIRWVPSSKRKDRAKIDIEELKEVRLGCSNNTARALGRRSSFAAQHNAASGSVSSSALSSFIHAASSNTRQSRST